MKLHIEFSGEEEFRKAFQEWSSRLIRKSGETLYRAVFERTPIDTGRARANWNCSVNTPDPSFRESADLDPGKASGAFAGAKAGDFLYITNAAPYILELENGHSDQAPDGMVRNAFRECAAQFESGE